MILVSIWYQYIRHISRKSSRLAQSQPMKCDGRYPAHIGRSSRFVALQRLVQSCQSWLHEVDAPLGLHCEGIKRYNENKVDLNGWWNRQKWWGENIYKLLELQHLTSPNIFLKSTPCGWGPRMYAMLFKAMECRDGMQMNAIDDEW